MAKFFRFPWATAGDKTTIPDAIDVTGLVSYQEGYGADYQRDPATDPLAKRIERDKMNQLFADVTSNIRHYQTNTFPEYITSADNGGVAFAYDVDAIVRYDDGGGYKLYQNTTAANTNVPTGAGWILFVTGVGLSSDQTFTGKNTFSKKLTTTDTTTSVTSGTYSSASNIVTVVMNVASHGIVIGDIIKVSGITNVQVATGGSNVQFNGYVRVTAQDATSVTFEIDTLIGTVGSTALTGTISFTYGGVYSDSIPKIKSGSTYFPMQPAVAYVDFDGTTTPPTISSAFNISAVVRVSTGVYDVYFKDTMPSANYISLIASDQVERFPTAKATNKFTFTTRNAASTVTNSTNCNVVIFGGLS